MCYFGGVDYYSSMSSEPPGDFILTKPDFSTKKNFLSPKKVRVKIFFFQDRRLNALDLDSGAFCDDFDRSHFIFRPAVTFLARSKKPGSMTFGVAVLALAS